MPIPETPYTRKEAYLNAIPFVAKREVNDGVTRYDWLYDFGTGPDPYAYMVEFSDMYVANSENDYPEKLA